MSSDHIYVNETPVFTLDAQTAFKNLTHQEQLYAHYLSKACWFGSLVVLVQTSPESPAIFALLRKLFSAKPIEVLKSIALEKAGMNEEEWKALLVYASAFYSNMGNYRGFGDSKFVPNVSKSKLQALVFAESLFEDKKERDFVELLWKECSEKLYTLSKEKLLLGFPPNGVTTYFSANMTEADAIVVKQFLKDNNIEAYNTRAFKDPSTGEYVIRFASILPTSSTEEREFLDKVQLKEVNGNKFRLERGDYAPLLELVNENLHLASKFASNQIEQEMLTKYIQHFRSGSLDAHMEGSRLWVQNKGPVIETYIGFIENYRDPAGQRAEFEGFVAMVNKEMSKKFNSLVENAPSFLPKLPWDRQFEKEKFSKPDFTSLDVLTFGSSGIPVGINIPNYDCIRDKGQFKNVSLGNVLTATESKPNFLSSDDADLLKKYSVASTEIVVGLHELLGHGSGRLLRRDENGQLNFDPAKTINPFTKKPVEKYYEYNETYDTKFGSLSSAMEECRAECVGLYLSLDSDVLRIFGFTEPNSVQDVIYVSWLSMVHKGIESLKMYNPEAKKWLQAHSQARYVITRVLLEGSKNLVKIEHIEKAEDGKPDLLISMSNDLQLIYSQGKQAIGNFLHQLQVYKSTGDSEAGVAWFNSYSQVDDSLEYPFLKFRDIAMLRKKPRRVFVQSSTSLVGESTVQLKSFDPTHEGVLESFKHHLDQNNVNLEQVLVDLAHKDKVYFD